MNQGDTLKHVRAGAPLRIKATTFNTIIDATRKIMSMANRPPRHLSRPEQRSSGIVLVKNASGTNQGRAAVLGISGPVLTPSGGDPAPLLSRLAVTGVVPDADYHRGQFVVTLEPVRDGEYGLAVADGLCHVQVDVADAAHQWADVKDGSTASLASGETGTARILWKESGTGVVWAVVLLGASPQTVLLVDSDTPEVDGPGLEYVTDDDGLDRLRAAVQATGGDFGALRFDANGSLYVALGFGLEDTADGAAADAAALAGDGLGEDGATGKLKALVGDNLVISGGVIHHDAHGEATQIVDYSDNTGTPMQMLFDAKGHFVGIQAPPP